MKNKAYLFIAIWLAFVVPVMAQVTPAEYVQAGNSLYTSQNYNKAIQYYEAALKSDPRSAEAYQGLGNCYYALGRKSDALLAYQTSLVFNPENKKLAAFTETLRTEVVKNVPVAPASTPLPLAVELRGDFAKPGFDHSLSMDEINELYQKGKHDDKRQIAAMYQSRSSFDISYLYQSRVDKNSGSYTGWVVKLSVLFEVGKSTVYIPKDEPPGSYAFDIYLKHEYHHAADLKRAYKKYRLRMEKALKAGLELPDRDRPVTANSRAELEKEISRKLHKNLDPIYEQYMKEYDRHAALFEKQEDNKYREKEKKRVEEWKKAKQAAPNRNLRNLPWSFYLIFLLPILVLALQSHKLMAWILKKNPDDSPGSFEDFSSPAAGQWGTTSGEIYQSKAVGMTLMGVLFLVLGVILVLAFVYKDFKLVFSPTFGFLALLGAYASFINWRFMKYPIWTFDEEGIEGRGVFFYKKTKRYQWRNFKESNIRKTYDESYAEFICTCKGREGTPSARIHFMRYAEFSTEDWKLIAGLVNIIRKNVTDVSVDPEILEGIGIPPPPKDLADP